MKQLNNIIAEYCNNFNVAFNFEDDVSQYIAAYDSIYVIRCKLQKNIVFIINHLQLYTLYCR